VACSGRALGATARRACGPDAAQAGQWVRPAWGRQRSELGEQWWACQDLNLGPHPETKIAHVATGSVAPRRAELGRAHPILIPRGGPRPCGSYQVSRAKRCADRRFPGRWRASGAKGCVLSDLVPSGPGKPGDLRALSGDSRTVKVLRRLGLTSSCRADPTQHRCSGSIRTCCDWQAGYCDSSRPSR
jgi:hypothetical protein